MKTLLRTLAILAAALVVVGALFAFSQSGSAQALRSEGRGHGHFDRERSEQSMPGESTMPFSRPERGQARGEFGERGGHESHGPSLFGFAEVIKNLAIIAVSVLLIVLGSRLLGPGKRATPPRRPPPVTGETTQL